MLKPRGANRYLRPGPQGRRRSRLVVLALVLGALPVGAGLGPGLDAGLGAGSQVATGPAPEMGATGFNQLGGDAYRSGEAGLRSGPLDIVATYDIVPDGENMNKIWGPPFVDSPHGVLGLTRANGTPEDPDSRACTLLRITDVLTGEHDRVPLDGCRDGWFYGYDPIHEAAIVCSAGAIDDPVVQSRDVLSGEVRWSRSPEELGILETNPEDRFSCGVPAIDEERGELVVPLLGTSTGADFAAHRVASLDLADGQIHWSTYIPPYAVAKTGTPPLLDPAGGQADSANFLPFSVTLTTTGILVPGLTVCPDNVRCSEPGEDSRPFHYVLGWLTRDGTVQGAQWSQQDPSEPLDPERATAGIGQSPGGAGWATAKQGLGLYVMGEQVYILDPQRSQVLASRSIEVGEGVPGNYTGWHGPAWVGDDVIVGLSQTMVSLRGDDLALNWVWPGLGADWAPTRVLSTPAGETLAMAGHRALGSVAIGEPYVDEMRLLRFAADEGAILQQVPVPTKLYLVTEPEIQMEDIGTLATWGSQAYPLPLGSQHLLIADTIGTTALMGPAGSGPHADQVSLSTSASHPQPGEPVTLQPKLPVVSSDDPAAVVEIIATWGEPGGRADKVPVEDGQPVEPLAHTYTSADRFEASLTALHADGTTTTRTVTFDVGGDPPPELNMLQRAFAPENQDMTFGVLGVALALGGGLIAVGRRRRNRSRLQNELDALEEGFGQTREHPSECEAFLDERKARARSLALDGYLEEGQVAIVNDRAEELRATLRTATVEAQLGFLPYALVQRALEMVEDGRITRLEHEAFIAALEDSEDILNHEQREQARERIDAWFTRDQGDGGPDTGPGG